VGAVEIVRLALLVPGFLLLGCRPVGSAGTPRVAAAVGVREIVRGLESPVHLTSPPGDARLFIVEQPGRIRIVENGRLLATPFLDITDRVRWGGERGLLSVAFHPQYSKNGLLFVNYTNRAGNTHIERYHVSPDRNRADPGSARLLLEIDQPYSNHNGGLVAFGPDGMLWIGMGDGGSANDPHGNGQNTATLLGKMLRIDVDRAPAYAVPHGNPFADGRGGRPEIWATGLRNPWRFAFDRVTGLLYIADVGQNRWEEIDIVPASTAGLNFGWNQREGAHPFRRGADGALVEPLHEYGHDSGCSVTGGYVYRGRELPELQGHYFFADYCQGWVQSFRYDGRSVGGLRRWALGDLGAVTSFGEDAAGELYILSQDGRVFRLVRPA
jgi:glucose/arabinose dehydrogenase